MEGCSVLIRIVWQAVDSHCVVATEVSEEWSVQTSSCAVFLLKLFRFRLDPVQVCPHSLPIDRESSYFRSLYLSVEVLSLHFWDIQFESWVGYRLFWLCCNIFHHLHATWGIFLRLGHETFLPNPLSFMNRPSIQHCTETNIFSGCAY